MFGREQLRDPRDELAVLVPKLALSLTIGPLGMFVQVPSSKADMTAYAFHWIRRCEEPDGLRGGLECRSGKRETRAQGEIGDLFQVKLQRRGVISPEEKVLECRVEIATALLRDALERIELSGPEEVGPCRRLTDLRVHLVNQSRSLRKLCESQTLVVRDWNANGRHASRRYRPGGP